MILKTRPLGDVINLNTRQAKATKRVLEKLFREHEAALRSFLLARLRNESELDDIVQEVFARLARRRDLNDRLREGFTKNRAYIFTAANNLVVDMERRNAVRRDYRVRTRITAGEITYELSPDVVIVVHEELSLVKEAIKKLKPHWRTAFVMNRLKCMSYKEISDCMGISERQVETCIASAVKMIRQTLARAYRDTENRRAVDG